MAKQIIIPTVTVEGLCELVRNGDVHIGDRFNVAGSFTKDSLTEEVIYNIQGRWLADTLVDDGRSNVIPEHRYMAGGNYKISLDSHIKGSKKYHSLLEAEEKKHA
jgi:hypothetical protein